MGGHPGLCASQRPGGSKLPLGAGLLPTALPRKVLPHGKRHGPSPQEPPGERHSHRRGKAGPRDCKSIWPALCKSAEVSARHKEGLLNERRLETVFSQSRPSLPVTRAPAAPGAPPAEAASPRGPRPIPGSGAREGPAPACPLCASALQEQSALVAPVRPGPRDFGGVRGGRGVRGRTETWRPPTGRPVGDLWGAEKHLRSCHLSHSPQPK